MGVVNFLPRSFNVWGKSPRCTLDRKLDGPQSRSGRCEVGKNLFPCRISPKWRLAENTGKDKICLYWRETLEKFVDYATTCTGSSPSQLTFPLPAKKKRRTRMVTRNGRWDQWVCKLLMFRSNHGNETTNSTFYTAHGKKPCLHQIMMWRNSCLTSAPDSLSLREIGSDIGKREWQHDRNRIDTKRWSYPCNKPWGPIGLRHIEAPTFSRQSAHRWRWGCQP
jgi:hypothetical protein